MRAAPLVFGFGLLLAACSGDDGAGSGAVAQSSVIDEQGGTSVAAPSATTAASAATTIPDTAPTVASTAPAVSSGSDGAGPPAGLDACQLLSPAEVAAALQVESVADGVEQPALFVGSVACQWDSESLLPPGFVRIELTSGEPEEMRSMYEQLAPDDATDPVGDVGDAARWYPLTNTLDVLAGPTFVAIQVLAPAGDDTASRVAAEIAATVLPRLQQ